MFWHAGSKGPVFYHIVHVYIASAFGTRIVPLYSTDLYYVFRIEASLKLCI